MHPSVPCCADACAVLACMHTRIHAYTHTCIHAYTHTCADVLAYRADVFMCIRTPIWPIQLACVRQEDPKTGCFLVSRVRHCSPAMEALVEVGDVLVEIDGRQVHAH